MNVTMLSETLKEYCQNTIYLCHKVIKNRGSTTHMSRDPNTSSVVPVAGVTHDVLHSCMGVSDHTTVTVTRQKERKIKKKECVSNHVFKYMKCPINTVNVWENQVIYTIGLRDDVCLLFVLLPLKISVVQSNRSCDLKNSEHELNPE